MAVPSSQLDRGELQLVTLASNDPNAQPAGGSAGVAINADYRIRLAVPLLFEPVEDYVMTVQFASFDPGKDIGLHQVAVSCSAPTLDGSRTKSTVAVIPVYAANAEFAWWPTATVVPWYPIASPLLTEIEVEIANISAGAPIAPSATPTVVTLAFRRVGSL